MASGGVSSDQWWYYELVCYSTSGRKKGTCGVMVAAYAWCQVGWFMSHLVTVVKAYLEVEEPVWHLYDEAYREKMVATGVKQWKGMGNLQR